MHHINKTILGLGLLFAASQSSNAATVFSDDFSSSTLNQTSNPNLAGTATSYDIASSKNSTGSSIATGALKILFPATTSGFAQAQARFTTAPVTLATVTDSITFTTTFTASNNILSGTAAAGSAITIGLYNSGDPSTSPLINLANSGLNTTTGSPNSTGGTQLWQGYVSRIVPSGSSSSIYTRPAQSGVDTTSQNQDLIGNNWGGGAYDTPQGATLGSLASTVVLTNTSQYTLQLIITLTAEDTYSIASNLFDGAGTGGTNLSSQTETASGANFLTSSFDGLALGYRYSGVSGASEMEVNSILVTSQIVPEVSSSVLMISSLAAFSFFRRRQR